MKTLLYKDACRWWAEELFKRAQRQPMRLFVAGVSGSIGRGKSTFCRYVASELNPLLSPSNDQALVRSLDDYYFSKARRYQSEFLSQGYCPEGISNRGPAGTHDLERLAGDLEKISASTATSTLDFSLFDKQADDTARESLTIRGRVRILLLEGWFVGAPAPIDSQMVPHGLKRSVAQALSKYQPIFDRLDVLWVFDSIPVEQIISERLEQQKALDLESGKPGMTAEQIRRFVRYFYQDSWSPPITSPEPLPSRVTWRAVMSADRRHIDIFESTAD